MVAILNKFTSAIPNNGDGDPLWDAYTGEDPNQTLILSAGSALIRTGNPGGVYLDFRPRNGVGAHVFSDGNTYAQHWLTSGTWDTNFNRLTFIFKTDSSATRPSNGSDNLQIGTYIREHNRPASPATAGNHYYHTVGMTYHPNKWFKMWINNHPQHQVGESSSIAWMNNPEAISAAPINYMDGLTRFYFDTAGKGSEGSTTYADTTWLFDNYVFDRVDDEPDFEVSTIIAGYTGIKYQVVWSTVRNVSMTYDIRYSSASMKESSFTSGVSGGSVTNTGNTWESVIWNSPDMEEYSNGIYIAIRPRTYPGSNVNHINPSTSGTFTEIYLPYNLNPLTDILGARYPEQMTSRLGDLIAFSSVIKIG